MWFKTFKLKSSIMRLKVISCKVKLLNFIIEQINLKLLNYLKVQLIDLT